MAAPIRMSARFLGSRRKAAAQNCTARHVWGPLRRWGSYLLADAVGTGKSYIALSIALGMFKRRDRRPFRLLVLAGPVELGHSWFEKLAGRTGHAIGTLAADAGDGSYLEMYWMGRRRPEFVTYHLRRRWDIDALEERLGSQDTPPEERNFFRPGGSSPSGRIEVLIATPKLLDQLRRRGAEGKWRKWIANADFIIADEVFGARNEDTVYGRLLREGADQLWPRKRPLLLGLSATLLSRDLPDAESVIKMAVDWGETSGARRMLSEKLRALLAGFRDSLRNGLRSSARDAVRDYRRAARNLEELLRSVIVRTRPDRKRWYHFWTGGLGKPEDPSKSRHFPVANIRKDVIDPLRKHAAGAPDAAEHLAWFLRRSPRTRTSTGPVSSRNYSSWTGITESPSLQDDAGKHPKVSSLSAWIKNYYSAAEQDWLKEGAHLEGPRFKLLIYVHHVRTAGHLNPRLTTGFGRRLQTELNAMIRGTCQKLARMLPALFKKGKLSRPSDEVRRMLLRRRWAMEQLLRRNPTLLLAALLNARCHKKSQLAAVSRTLQTSKPRIAVDQGRLLLQRSRFLREKIFEDKANILAFDGRQLRKTKERTLAGLLLDVSRMSAQVQGRLRRALRLEKGEYRALGFGKPEGPSLLRLEEIARKVRAAFDTDEAWLRLVARANHAPRRVHRKLMRRLALGDRQHREPASIAVLTGSDSENRTFVTRRFCEPGNPFMLVLTHVCQIGIDLHPFCWDMLHYSPSWTPHEGEQKTGRIDRPRLRATVAQLAIGDPRRRHDIRVHHVIWPFTYDERILSRLNVRAQYAERLLGSKGNHDAADDQARRLNDFKPLELEAGR